MSRDRKAREGPSESSRGRDYRSEIILYAPFLTVPSFPFPSAWNGDDVLALHSSVWCGILARNHHAVGNARNQNPIIEGVSRYPQNSDQGRRGGT